MQEIKATSVVPTMEYVMYDIGKDTYKNILAKLAVEQQKLFKRRMLPSQWIALKDFAAFNHAVVEEVWDGNVKKGHELGYETADRSFGNFYKLFMRLGNPNKVAQKASSLFETVHRPGQQEVLKNEKGHIRFEVSGFEEPYEIIFHRMAGYYCRASELTGAKNVICNMENPDDDWSRVRFDIRFE